MAAVLESVEGTSVEDTPVTSIPATPRTVARTYWQAQGVAELALTRFTEAAEQGDRAAQRRAFYLLTGFYGRTRRIVQAALAEENEPLAKAALRNLVVLHRPLTQMHRTAPKTVPLAVVLDPVARDDLTRDLVVRALSE